MKKLIMTLAAFSLFASGSAYAGCGSHGGGYSRGYSALSSSRRYDPERRARKQGQRRRRQRPQKRLRLPLRPPPRMPSCPSKPLQQSKPRRHRHAGADYG